jgi:hypothetical protein
MIGALLVHLAYLANFSTNSYSTVLLTIFVCSLLTHSRRRWLATLGIRTQPPGHPCKIMAPTANALSSYREACIAPSIDDYLANPLQSEGLKMILNRFVPALIE